MFVGSSSSFIEPCAKVETQKEGLNTLSKLCFDTAGRTNGQNDILSSSTRIAVVPAMALSIRTGTRDAHTSLHKRPVTCDQL